MADFTKKITAEYYKQHEVCPKCGNGVGTTLAGYIYEPDMNNCWCQCGWRGICHDLVPDLAAEESDEVHNDNNPPRQSNKHEENKMNGD